MRHDTAQENPERLRYWYCPDCGERYEVTQEIQRLQSALANSQSDAEQLREERDEARRELQASYELVPTMEGLREARRALEKIASHELWPDPATDLRAIARVALNPERSE